MIRVYVYAKYANHLHYCQTNDNKIQICLVVVYPGASRRASRADLLNTLNSELAEIEDSQ